MRPGRKRGLTDPIGPLAAHMRVPRGLAIHPLRHIVAADTGIGPTALRHFGRAVMRAAGTEIRQPRGQILSIISRPCRAQCHKAGVDTIARAVFFNQNLT